MKDKKPKSRKKFMFKILLILVLILLVLFTFRHNIEATFKGVNVKYIENPKYCQVDSDCVPQSNNCGAINIYNFKDKNEMGQCLRETCGASCAGTECMLENCNFEEK